MLFDLHTMLQIVRVSLDRQQIANEPRERQRLMDSIIDEACDVKDGQERERLADRQAFRRSQIKGQDRTERESKLVRNKPMDRLESNRRLDLTN